MFGFTIVFTLSTRLWVTSSGFTIVGLLLIFGMPRLLRSAGTDPGLRWGIAALGWAFLLLGVAVLVPMFMSLVVARTNPGRQHDWHRWINYCGGLAGALLFAIPATLVLPAFCVAYGLRPNLFFPEGVPAAKLFWLGGLFTTLGVITLVAVFYLGRYIGRQRRRRRR